MGFQCSHLASATSSLAYSLAAKVSQSSVSPLESGPLEFSSSASPERIPCYCVISIMEARSNLQDFFEPISSRKLSRFSLERKDKKGSHSRTPLDILEKFLKIFQFFDLVPDQISKFRNDCRIELRLALPWNSFETRSLRIQISEDKLETRGYYVKRM